MTDDFQIELDELTPDSQHRVIRGQQKLRRQDRKLRTPQKHFATASPLVRPLEPILLYKLEQLLLDWLKKDERRQGAWIDLHDLLVNFIDETKVAPLVDEAPQPQLGISLVAMAIYFATMDNLHVEGAPRKAIPEMKDHISRLLQLEWIRRRGLSSDELREVEAVEKAFASYGKKAKQTLDRRGTNINLLLNKLRDTPNEALVKKLGLPEKMFDMASLSILSLLADAECWKDGKTFLQLVGTKQNYVELNPEGLEDNTAIGLGDSLKKRLHAMQRTLRFREALQLPITGDAIPWRHTNEPDCLNATGGYQDQPLRTTNPLGHGHHRDYKSVASQEALDAVNHCQQVLFMLDEDMAEFILECDSISHKPGESIPELAGKPKFTREELGKGTGITATFECVKNRERGIALIPDSKERNSKAGLQRIKNVLGFDWEENNNKLRLLYIQADEDLCRYQRTISITTRITELRGVRYKDGFSWVFGMDHRGRLYEKSDYFSPQRSDPERYSLRFAKGQQLDEAAKKQVFIAIGGAVSGTKISHKQREEIGRSMLEDCRKIGSDLFAHRHQIFAVDETGNPVFDEPWMFAQLCAAVHRSWDWHEDWTTPLFIDATCSGIQWWSSITNDETVQRLCNLGSASEEDEPFDAYRAVQESVAALLAKDDNSTKLYRYTEKRKQKECTPEERDMVDEVIKMRKALKSSLMTRGYGSTLPTRIDGLHEIVRRKFGNNTPRHIAVVAAKIIHQAMTETYKEIFAAELFVKQVARQAVKLQMSQVEFDEFNYQPREPNELTLEEFRERKEAIGNYADALEAGDQELANTLAAQLKDQERNKTKAKFQKRITDEVATEWRRDRLLMRCDAWFSSQVKAKNEHDARHAFKADCNLTWTVADGYKVSVIEPYRTMAKAIKAGVLPQLRLNMTVPETIDRHRLIRASAPSFIHSLDSCLLRRVVNKLKTDCVVIHDCCGVLPGQIVQLRKVVAEEMAAIIGSDGRQLLLDYLCEQIPEGEVRDDLAERLVNDFTKKMTTPLSEVLPNALYMWN